MYYTECRTCLLCPFDRKCFKTLFQTNITPTPHQDRTDTTQMPQEKPHQYHANITLISRPKIHGPKNQDENSKRQYLPNIYLNSSQRKFLVRKIERFIVWKLGPKFENVISDLKRSIEERIRN